MLEAYRQHADDRALQGIPPLPLDAEQTSALCELLKHPPAGKEQTLLELLRDRIFRRLVFATLDLRSQELFLF